jgi:hypothetical protein
LHREILFQKLQTENKTVLSRVLWLMPVILATWEAEIKRIVV